jgi:hypothetical protein
VISQCDHIFCRTCVTQFLERFEGGEGGEGGEEGSEGGGGWSWGRMVNIVYTAMQMRKLEKAAKRRIANSVLRVPSPSPST